LLKPKGSIYTRQYAAAFVTQCTLSLSLNVGEGKCQNYDGSIRKILTLRKIRFVVFYKKLRAILKTVIMVVDNCPPNRMLSVSAAVAAVTFPVRYSARIVFESLPFTNKGAVVLLKVRVGA